MKLFLIVFCYVHRLLPGKIAMREASLSNTWKHARVLQTDLSQTSGNHVEQSKEGL